MEKYIVFSLQDARYAAPARHVDEVMRPTAFTHLPGADPAILGLINVRGRILPVIDLSVPMNGAHTDEPAKGLVLLVSSPRGEIGLLVDDVHGLVELPTHAAAPTPGTLRHGRAATGVLNHQGRALTLLDLRNVIEGAIGDRPELVRAAS